MTPDFSSTTGPHDKTAQSVVRSASGRSAGGTDALGTHMTPSVTDSDSAGGQLGEGRNLQPVSLPVKPRYFCESCDVWVDDGYYDPYHPRLGGHVISRWEMVE